MRLRNALLLLFFVLTAGARAEEVLPFPLDKPQRFIIETREAKVGECTVTLREKDDGYVLTESLEVALPAFSKQDGSELFLDAHLYPQRYRSELSLTVSAQPKQNGDYAIVCDFQPKQVHGVLRKKDAILQDRRVAVPDVVYSYETMKMGQWGVLTHKLQPGKTTKVATVFIINDMNAAPVTFAPVSGEARLKLTAGTRVFEPVSVDMMANRVPLGRLILEPDGRLLAALLPGGIMLRHESIAPFGDQLASPDQHAIENLLDNLEQAWLKEDRDAIERIYDERFLGAASAPRQTGVVKDRRELMKDLKTLWDSRDYARHAFTQRAIEVNGQTAHVRAVLEDQPKGAPVSTVTVHILLVKRKDQWRVVAFSAGLPEMDIESLKRQRQAPVEIQKLE